MSKMENYILDLGFLIAEKAREAKQLADNDAGNRCHDYQLGYLMAFHEVVSLMQQQADAFGIARMDIGLGDLEPETDLI